MTPIVHRHRRFGVLMAILAALTAIGISATMTETASAHPVRGCNSKTYRGYSVHHLHLYGSQFPAVTVCKAYKRIRGGRFQVFYKIKGQGGPRQVQVANDGMIVRTYFVQRGTGTIKSRLKGKRTFFRTCRPNGTECASWR